jgi:hypothetical protein
MKQSKKPKRRQSKRQREFAVLQVQEYAARYYPKLGDVVVDVSPCGTFASVRKVPDSATKDKKPND